jgi:regulatory protein
MAGDARARRAARLAERAKLTDPDTVLAAAARLIEARQRSTVETRRRLIRAGYPEPLVDTAIARLTDLGLLDDAAFARAWVESRDRARPRGERALRYELRSRGMSPELAEAALAERRAVGHDTGRPGSPFSDGPPFDAALDPADEPAVSADERAAERLIGRNARALARVADPRARRQRAYALLARNGFDPNVASRVALRSLASADTADEVAPDE